MSSFSKAVAQLLSGQNIHMVVESLLEGPVVAPTAPPPTKPVKTPSPPKPKPWNPPKPKVVPSPKNRYMEV